MNHPQLVMVLIDVNVHDLNVIINVHDLRIVNHSKNHVLN
jgi:hypothetical protein